MKALFLNKFFFAKGGAEKVFFEEMSLLRNHGHEVIPFSRKHPNNVRSEYDKYFADELSVTSRFSIGSVKTALKIIYSFDVKKRLEKLIHATKPQIVHAHNIYGLLTTSTLDVCRRHGIPVVLTLHDYKIICPNYQFLRGSQVCEECKTNRFYRAMTTRCVHGSMVYSTVYGLENYFNTIFKKYVNRVAFFVAPSTFMRNKFIEYGFPEDRVVCIPNFIDTSSYEPSYDGKGAFLYLGRISKEKGIQTLINAFGRIAANHHKLIIVGEGPLRDNLHRETLNRPATQVEFTGYLTGEELQRTIQASSCVVVPSEWYENCPMSVLEALAYGKPVIGADIGGIPELITHAVDGLMFKSGDARDLADKMNYMANLSEHEYQQMARNARANVERRFNAEGHYVSLMALYNRVLN